jgi:hypothetical protein
MGSVILPHKGRCPLLLNSSDGKIASGAAERHGHRGPVVARFTLIGAL